MQPVCFAAKHLIRIVLRPAAERAGFSSSVCLSLKASLTQRQRIAHGRIPWQSGLEGLKNIETRKPKTSAWPLVFMVQRLLVTFLGSNQTIVYFFSPPSGQYIQQVAEMPALSLAVGFNIPAHLNRGAIAQVWLFWSWLFENISFNIQPLQDLTYRDIFLLGGRHEPDIRWLTEASSWRLTYWCCQPVPGNPFVSTLIWCQNRFINPNLYHCGLRVCWSARWVQFLHRSSASKPQWGQTST